MLIKTFTVIPLVKFQSSTLQAKTMDNIVPLIQYWLLRYIHIVIQYRNPQDVLN